MAQSRSPGVFSVVRDFWRHERGATAVEYAIMAALIALFIIGSISALYSAIVKNFNILSNAL